MILENKLNLLTEKIKTSEFLISEMKRIGIEKLPYSQSSLKRFIDSKTMDVHYNGHYKTYVKKLNDALSKKNYGDVELEDIIKSISKYNQTIRNNAGGAFNHALFWKMLSPKTQEIPSEIKNKIIKNFGSVNKFKEEFGEVAKDRFGSGWCWLILTKGNKLKIMSTPNQDNPLMNVIDGGGFPLLGLDLWEHAYYLKYQNKRDEYIKNFWDVVNWEFVNDLFLKRNKTKLTESVLKEDDNTPKTEFILPNGSINPKIFKELLPKVYPECNPKIITNYDLNQRIPNACYGKIQSNVCDTDYGVIGGKYALSQLGGIGEWSAINYFDGSVSVGKQLLSIYEKFNSEKSDFETWINKMKKTLFGDNGKFIQNLVKIVINPENKSGSLDRGIERENIAEKILNNKFKTMKITRFCDGDKKDKYKGQDMVGNKDGVEKYVQIKSLFELFENKNENGEITYVFNHKNQYLKNNIQVFGFVESENNYIFFDFDNAEIIDNGTEAEKRYSYIFKPSDIKFKSNDVKIKKLTESVKYIFKKEQLKKMFILNEDDEEMGKKVPLSNKKENILYSLCENNNVFCQYIENVIDKINNENLKKEIINSFDKIYNHLYGKSNETITSQSLISRITELALQNDLPGQFIKVISKFTEKSTIQKNTKALETLLTNPGISLTDLDEYLEDLRRSAYAKNEIRLRGNGKVLEKFATALKINFKCEKTDFNRITVRGFRALLGKIQKNEEVKINIAENVLVCILQDLENLKPIKADLVSVVPIYDVNKTEVFPAKTYFEAKMMDINADSYLSEMFSIFKDRDVNKKDYLSTYNYVIDYIYPKIKKNKIGIDFLEKIKSNLGGVFFENDILIPIEYIQLYWSNKGQKECDEKRLSIRFKVLPFTNDEAKTPIKMYKYEVDSDILLDYNGTLDPSVFKEIECK